MAKPRPVAGIDPDRRLRYNGRRILATRIDEVWAFAPFATHPGHVRELHDMRIACKRLRYLLEIFAVAFREDLEPYIDEIKGLQEVLGDIHDRDVQIPMLHDHLERLAERDADAARAALREAAGARPARRPRSEAAFARFRAQLDAQGAADERPGIVALLARRSHERDVRYREFLTTWSRLEDTGFRSRLERAIGV